MTTYDFEELFRLTLAAADPHASAKDKAAFCIEWANYKKSFPDEGHAPFNEAATLAGFDKPSPERRSGYIRLRNALDRALEHCSGPGPNGSAGAQRRRRRGYNR